MDITTDFVVYVHGPPRTGAAQDACQQVIQEISGEIQKLFAGPFESQDFLSHTLGNLLRQKSRPIDPRSDVCLQRGILVMTEFSNLMFSVIKPRRDLTHAHPVLASLLWIAFVDDDQPFFERSAADLGTMNEALDRAPIWTVRTEDQRFLVLTPRTKSDLARRNARLLVPTGFAKATNHGFLPPTEAEIEEAKRRYGSKP